MAERVERGEVMLGGLIATGAIATEAITLTDDEPGDLFTTIVDVLFTP